MSKYYTAIIHYGLQYLIGQKVGNGAENDKNKASDKQAIPVASFNRLSFTL